MTNLPTISKKPKASKARRRRFTPREYAKVIADQGGICKCGCGEPLGDNPLEIHFDHVIPLWMNGLDILENLAALIRKHHLHKTSKEAKALAKVRRIEAADGHRRRNMSAADRQLAKLLESET